MARQSTPTDEACIITLDGYNTEVATPEQCAIHSGFDYPKCREENEAYIEVPITSPFPTGTTNLVDIGFNGYGYKHCYVVWLEISTLGGYIRPNTYTVLPYSSLGGIKVVSYITQGNHLKIDFINNTGDSLDLGSIIMKFKYQIWDNQVDV
jgi:hypothetical protein